jgi:hypothetical protein
MSEAASDYDSPWKEALEQYFEAFLALCFPEVHAGIDWSRGHEFLDKELQAIVRDAESGRRYVDKLVKVWRKDGAEAWVLIHIEVQGQPDAAFTERMWIYHYRLYDRYRRQVVSLGVLSDTQAEWRPAGFGYALWGCDLSLRFPTVKLLDFQKRWEELEASRNPFAVVIMAHLKAQETRRAPRSRFQAKLQLVRGLYERGWSRTDVLELFRFIDWMVALPEALISEFRREVEALEEEKQMPYVTSIERMAIEEGREEGREEALIESILEILETRFTDVPQHLLEAMRQTGGEERLRRLRKLALTVNSIGDFAEELEREA